LPAEPVITVAVPLYNKAGTIHEAIASALSQSVREFEIVVVDDGSMDDSAARVRELDDPRVVLIAQLNAGVAAARNRALDAARGPFVAFLDADDVWRPDHLRHLLELTRRFPQAVLFGNRFVEFSGGSVPAGSDRPPTYSLLDEFFAAWAYGPQPFFTSSCMVKREEALAAGGFPAGHSRGEDLALWIEIAARHPVAVSSYVGCGYRRGPDALTARLVTEPDISMRTLDRLIAEDVGWTPTRKRHAREYYHRIALAHCLDALRAGDMAAAQRFLDLASGTSALRGRWWRARLLAAAPRPLRELSFAAFIRR
jgi:glycosyltransferase involved in cell wall biosynthesis